MSEPLRLPEGYTIKPTKEDNLMLLRADGSPVVVFEFTSFGPDPTKIMQIAWDDAEYREQLKQNDSDADKGYR